MKKPSLLFLAYFCRVYIPPMRSCNFPCLLHQSLLTFSGYFTLDETFISTDLLVASLLGCLGNERPCKHVSVIAWVPVWSVFLSRSSSMVQALRRAFYLGKLFYEVIHSMVLGCRCSGAKMWAMIGAWRSSYLLWPASKWQESMVSSCRWLRHKIRSS